MSNETRKYRRFKIPHQPATVQTLLSRRKLPCKLVDVSQEGLAIAIEEDLLPDTQVRLQLGAQWVYLTLMWGQPPKAPGESYHFGFKVLDPSMNLVYEFLALGHVNLRVLAVDDEPDIVELYAASFEALGHRVETAHCGDEASALMAAKEFDLVVSDMVMPNGNGLAVVRDARHHGIPVALVTAYGSKYLHELPADVPVLDMVAVDLTRIPLLTLAGLAKVK